MGQEKEGLSEDSGIKFYNLQIKNINNLLAYGYGHGYGRLGCRHESAIFFHIAALFE